MRSVKLTPAVTGEFKLTKEASRNGVTHIASAQFASGSIEIGKEEDGGVVMLLYSVTAEGLKSHPRSVAAIREYASI